MSLKNFHIVFVVLAALCLLGFGAWTLTASGEQVTQMVKATGFVSGVLGVALVLYGVWFAIRKRSRLVT